MTLIRVSRGEGQAYRFGSRTYQYQNITTMPTMNSHGRVMLSGVGSMRLSQKTYSSAPMDSSFLGPQDGAV